jgi:hypothetical protein
MRGPSCPFWEVFLGIFIFVLGFCLNPPIPLHRTCLDARTSVFPAVLEKCDAAVHLSLPQFAADPRICVPSENLSCLLENEQVMAALADFTLETEHGYFAVRTIKNQQAVVIRLPNKESLTLQILGPHSKREVLLFQPKLIPQAPVGKLYYGMVSIDSNPFICSSAGKSAPVPAENITEVTFTFPFPLSDEFRCVEFSSQFNHEIPTSCQAGENKIHLATCRCNHLSPHSSELKRNLRNDTKTNSTNTSFHSNHPATTIGELTDPADASGPSSENVNSNDNAAGNSNHTENANGNSIQQPSGEKNNVYLQVFLAILVVCLFFHRKCSLTFKMNTQIGRGTIHALDFKRL